MYLLAQVAWLNVWSDVVDKLLYVTLLGTVLSMLVLMVLLAG
jgi:hypothetical protein